MDQANVEEWRHEVTGNKNTQFAPTNSTVSNAPRSMIPTMPTTLMQILFAKADSVRVLKKGIQAM